MGRIRNRKEGNYTLVKKIRMELLSIEKFYIDGKLDRFNLSKQKDEIETLKKFITHSSTILMVGFQRRYWSSKRLF